MLYLKDLFILFTLDLKSFISISLEHSFNPPLRSTLCLPSERREKLGGAHCSLLLLLASLQEIKFTPSKNSQALDPKCLVSTGFLSYDAPKFIIMIKMEQYNKDTIEFSMP